MGFALEVLPRIRYVRYVIPQHTILVSDADPKRLLNSRNVWCVSMPRGISVLGTHPTSQTGILTDLLVYSLIIPVIPYQLEALGYDAIGSKVSWLLVAFVCVSGSVNRLPLIRLSQSGALVLSTPPVAHFSEVYRNRKIPLLTGLIALIGSQIMFMEAPVYWLMILARILQGISSTVIWTIGLALLYVRRLMSTLQAIFPWLPNSTDHLSLSCRCDTAPENHLGRQFGIVSMGLTIGLLVGPPVAGILYERLGYRAPFVFGIIVTGIDFLARLLLIERHEAMRWGVDPMAIAAGSKNDPEAEVTDAERAEHSSVPEPRPDEGEGGTKAEVEEKTREGDQAEKQPQEPKQSRTTLLPHVALLRLMRSPRAAVSIILTLIWGLGWAGQESVVVLHMNDVWGLDPRQAGTAFIAAVVPTIFCEPNTPSPLP